MIQVEQITPAETTPLEEATEQITQTLLAARQQQIAQSFQEDFQTKWVARTFCADDYRIDRCSNAEPPPNPCTEEIAETEGCDAPVPSTRPIAPGAGRCLRSPGDGRPAAGPDQTPAPPTPPGGVPPGLAAAGRRCAPRHRASGHSARHRTAAPRRRARLRPAPLRPRLRRRAEPGQPMADRQRGGSEAEPSAALDALARLDRITRRLRRECPWDREQDERSIVPHTVEEAYELADAAQRGDDEKLRDELGDVLFQVLFLSLLLEERGAGSLADVAEGMSEKLIRRHPHVFGDAEAATAGEVLRNWDQIKREVEGRGVDDPFADVPENLPGLLYARKMLRRAEPEGGGPHDAERRDEDEAAVGEMLLEAVAALAPAGRRPGACPARRGGPVSRQLPLASRLRNGCDRAHPRPPDPRFAGQPDGRGRGRPSAPGPRVAPPSPPAPRPASSRRPSCATAARRGPARG